MNVFPCKHVALELMKNTIYTGRSSIARTSIKLLSLSVSYRGAMEKCGAERNTHTTYRFMYSSSD